MHHVRVSAVVHLAAMDRCRYNKPNGGPNQVPGIAVEYKVILQTVLESRGIRAGVEGLLN